MRFAPSLLILACVYILPAAHADTVYSQPYTTEAVLSSSGTRYVSYDNFTLSSAVAVTGVDWDGVIFQSGMPATSFTIDFYANNGGAPGALLASNLVGSADPVSTGTPFVIYSIDSYHSAITPFAAAAGTEYWISIVGDAASDFGWSTGSGGDGRSYQSGVDGPGSAPVDLAFALNDSSVSATPEPSSLILLGTGLAGAAGMAGRRFRAMRVSRG